MSADMMIICKEDNSHFDGDSEGAFFIDETSMGDPHHAFGKWFAQRFCGAPDIFAQLAGFKEHRYTMLTKADQKAIKAALSEMDIHPGVDKNKLMEFVTTHIGKHISTENW